MYESNKKKIEEDLDRAINLSKIQYDLENAEQKKYEDELKRALDLSMHDNIIDNTNDINNLSKQLIDKKDIIVSPSLSIIKKKKMISWPCLENYYNKKITYKVHDTFSRSIVCTKKQKYLWRYSDNYSNKLQGRPYRSIIDPLKRGFN